MIKELYICNLQSPQIQNMYVDFDVATLWDGPLQTIQIQLEYGICF